MCSYVLGIGDRHLENFLVDQTTGAVIPIDFGMAFGQGASLPVPELIPFRLTPQVGECAPLYMGVITFSVQPLWHQRSINTCVTRYMNIFTSL